MLARTVKEIKDKWKIMEVLSNITRDTFKLQPKVLKYSIANCPSVSQTFQPENILEDKPFDQASR